MDVHTGPGFNSFFSQLFAFCMDSFSTCFSRDSDKPCVLIALSSLSSLALLLSCLLLMYRRCRCRGEDPAEETIISLYCLLGNLCSTVGAILSTQLYIQVLMGAFAAAVDAVNVMFSCFPVLLCWNTKTERRLRVIRRRRRQHLLAVCVLMVVAGGFMKSPVKPADRLLSGRRLLHVTLQDNTEILGYVLGLISFVIVCTSRFPPVCRVYRGWMLTQAQVFSGLLCSLAGALYAAVLLLYDTRMGFLLRVMPWLLSAICGVCLDLLILILHWCKRGTRHQFISLSPDTESLLGGSGISTEENVAMKNHRKQKMNSSPQTETKNVQKMSEMGRYMDVCLQEAEGERLDGAGRGIRVESFVLSDTSFDSSTVSSDLEWDFEEANDQWRGPTAKRQEDDEFPLQQCPANPKPFTICTCSVSGLLKKTLSGKEESVRSTK
ncbi:transmembrane protein 44 isoform X2 [Hippoglossus hippoglossus]|uniref:transmembrane protein 44 isoform X2 n=1 Tax=Hippoglossus hippoglossus TaxID=8267 RepID=UPI00148E6C49|nr:transmembrane protein 44 isoform X2 [Hippoglossus hippoglossus]